MKKGYAFWLCLIVSVGLFIGGFFVPPLGVIDGSVITAVGLLLGFAVIGQIPAIISVAKSAKITAGGTTIEINKKPEQIEDAEDGNAEVIS